MDADPLNAVVLTAVLSAVFFYVLYAVIRAATRDGIMAARRLTREDQSVRGEAGSENTSHTVGNG